MSRKGENIYKRKDGRWEGRYIKSHENGKAHYGYVYGKTYKEVKQQIIISAQNTTVTIEHTVTASDLPAPTFRETALEWLAVSQKQLKESSYVKYRGIINNHLLPSFGNCLIDKITRNDISQFCNILLSEDNDTPALSARTVSTVICVLKKIFDYAAQVKQYTTIDLRGMSKRQNLCLDAGYTGKQEAVTGRHYIPHIVSRGEEKKQKEKNPEFKARRWVVEVLHSHLNRFRKLLVRFEKKANNYLALIHFACAVIVWRKLFPVHQI